VFTQVLRLYPTAKFILFSNNPQQCLRNLNLREDNRTITEEYIFKLSSIYAPQVFQSMSTYSELREVI